jgi:hypothetical protein
MGAFYIVERTGIDASGPQGRRQPKAGERSEAAQQPQLNLILPERIGTLRQWSGPGSNR